MAGHFPHYHLRVSAYCAQGVPLPDPIILCRCEKGARTGLTVGSPHRDILLCTFFAEADLRVHLAEGTGSVGQKQLHPARQVQR